MTARIFYYLLSYFFVAMALSLLLVPLMRPLAFKLDAVDMGLGRRIHKGIVPRLGGVGIFLAFFIPGMFSLTRGVWDEFNDKMVGVFLASVIVVMIGIRDDVKGARISYKLFAEVLAALIIYVWGIRITELRTPFGQILSLGWLSLPITVLWIVIVTNAINLIDGLDGLAAGTGIFIASTFLFLSVDNLHLQVLLAIIAGSLAGFLVYNFPPASIFMGDSGSLFIGFFLGTASIVSGQKATAMATIMVPMIAFGLPLIDMTYAVLRRYYRGVPLGEADSEHIHHKLLDKGLSKRKVLLVLYIINVTVMLVILVFVRRRLNIDFLGLLLLAGAAVVGLRMLGYLEFIPKVKEMRRHFEIGRKRKYYNYVIRRFIREAGESTSLNDLTPHLNRLMQEYKFNSAEIRLSAPSAGNPLYHFQGPSEPKKPMTLSFPITGNTNAYVGHVRICKEMDDDYFLCTAELVRALSEGVGRFMSDNSAKPDGGQR